jgi:hypothetical protein
MTDAQQYEIDREFTRLSKMHENPVFSESESDRIVAELDEAVGVSNMVSRLWVKFHIDIPFQNMPPLFMAKIPGQIVSYDPTVQVQWEWEGYHFMLYRLEQSETHKAIIALFIDDTDPVFELYVENENAADARMPKINIERYQAISIRPGEWLNKFASYHAAFWRTDILCKIVRDQKKSEMQAFWDMAKI